MQTHWVNYWNDGEWGGRLYGYTASARLIQSWLAGSGIELTSQAKVAIHYCHPFLFKAIPNKINVLWTMHENETLEKVFIDKFKECDYVFTPSRFCRKVFKKHTKKKIFVVPLGIDEEIFFPAERKIPQVLSGSLKETLDRLYSYALVLDKSMTRGNVLPVAEIQPSQILEDIEPLVLDEPFLFMYNGAPNVRKGWSRVLGAWSHFFAGLPWANLVLKTSVFEKEGDVAIHGNVVFDSRKWSVEDLSNLYRDAHAFVLPSYGEGFGLTILEALACGAPIITTRFSSQMDFLIDPKTKEEFALFPNATFDKLESVAGESSYCPVADIPSLAIQMIKIIYDQERYLQIARRGSDFVRSNFAWKNTVDHLVDAVKEIECL